MSVTRALFVSHGVSRAGWYRCVLPAMFGGWDWAALGGDPPGLHLYSSWIDQATREPDFLSYDVVVIQQARGEKWAGLIRKMRSHGVKVLYEIDDYVHGIRHADDHDFRQHYQKQHLKQMEVCMRACDGIIVSTEYLRSKYEYLARDRPVFVCENGLDMGRYRLTRPPRGEVNGRETVSVLWSGATGHQRTVLPWMVSVAEVMQRVGHASFVSVGQDFAATLHSEFPDRTISVPFTSLECYPCAMMMGDVIIAPAGKSEWSRSKSQLRAMESAALGVPVVADAFYGEAVRDRETGILVTHSAQVRAAIQELVEDDALRIKMGEAARKLAYSQFDMTVRVKQWTEVIDGLC